MNNKLLARIVAVASCVTMLGTVAFAADPVATKDTATTTASLNFVVDSTDISASGEDQITMMAYLIDAKDANGDAYTAANAPAYGEQTVVALDQIAGKNSNGENVGFGSVPLDYTKLADGKAMVVKLGGSNGNAQTFVVSYDAATETVTVTFMNGGETAYKTVTVEKGASLDLSTIEEPTLTVDTSLTDYAMVKKNKSFTFAGWVDAEDADVTSLTEVNEDITLTAKYDTGFVYGDSNGDGKANATDRSGIITWMKTYDTDTNTGTVARNHFTNMPIYPGVVNSKGVEIVAGDSNGDGKANATDRSGIITWMKSYDADTNSGTVARNHLTNKPIYFINK